METNEVIRKQRDSAIVRSRIKVVQAFLDINLSYMHDGLKKICQKNGIKVTNLQLGEVVPFINKSMTYIKVLAGNGTEYPVIAAYRLPPGRKVSLEVIKDIAVSFRGNGLWEANKTLEAAVLKNLEEVNKSK
jgi:hypothetical protein